LATAESESMITSNLDGRHLSLRLYAEITAHVATRPASSPSTETMPGPDSEPGSAYVPTWAGPDGGSVSRALLMVGTVPELRR
jgi:hypothetical protein